jgi:hypothetical protein
MNQLSSTNTYQMLYFRVYTLHWYCCSLRQVEGDCFKPAHTVQGLYHTSPTSQKLALSFLAFYKIGIAFVAPSCVKAG